MSVFDIVTNDDWYGVFNLGASYSYKWPTVLFVFTMIYLINYLTLGILMAILLDGFSKYINEQEDDVAQHNKEVFADEKMQRLMTADVGIESKEAESSL